MQIICTYLRSSVQLIQCEPHFSVAYLFIESCHFIIPIFFIASAYILQLKYFVKFFYCLC